MSFKAVLQRVPFLSEIAEDQLQQLVERGREMSADARQILFQEGDAAQGMYVLLSGQVRIYLRDEHGHEVDLALKEPGDFFGEMALLDGGTRSATAASVSPCTFFVLDRAGFMDLLAGSPASLSRLLTHLTANVRTTTDKYFREGLAKQTLRAEMEIERHRALAQMVAGVAHELNTPLGIINTAASVIRRELTSDTLRALATDPKVARVLEDVLEATDLVQKHIARAHTLVQSFKNIAVGQITDVRETMNLSEAVAETLDLFKINARKARLTVDLDDRLPDHDRTWEGYRGHLSRVLLNLLTNVERYAYPGGTGGRVVVSLDADHERTVPCFLVTVRDFGRGIAPENLSKVFDPFFTTGRGAGGTGLGMAIVYNVVTSALHGTVAIESEVDRGTTVRVTVPQTVPA